HFKAQRGVHGMGKNMHGAWGEDTVARVPVGTIVYDDDTGEVIADFTEHGQEALIAKGGRGGRGNSRFANSIHKAPNMHENGEPGQERYIRLELKLLGDVGLVGFPNAGKSTLISRLSAARPKIADYPFTTLIPNLGVMVSRDKAESCVIADIPGLIEGAHEGAGLGHDFLRHIERTRLLLFVLDCAETDGRDVLDDYNTLRQELERYNPKMLERPQLIAANKLDVPEAVKRFAALKQSVTEDIYGISAVTGEGIEPLRDAVFAKLREAPRQSIPVIDETVVRKFEEEEPFSIVIENGVYVVTGKRIENLLIMTNLNEDESLQRFQRTTERMGLDQALRDRGIKAGDTVRILDMEFEYSD
ncbi:MAG: GTPase ObgE, partial [Syntrophomonadaceae bacterium]|nr:GTPase ObgE [Syntrophomonadaceae bacterium]